MGLETALAIGAGSQVLGGILGYGENKAAAKRASQTAAKGSAIAGAPLASTATINQALNSGQDSFLQYLRANPTALRPFQFDASSAFDALKANDQQTINDQINQLSAGAGSLGARFGSGFAAQDALTRERFASGIAARNAGIAQSSFNTALNAGLTDFQAGQNTKLQLMQLLQSGILGQRGQQLQALGLNGAIPSSGAGSIVGGTGSDIGQLLLLANFLGNKNTTPAPGGGASSIVPPPSSTVSQTGLFS